MLDGIYDTEEEEFHGHFPWPIMKFGLASLHPHDFEHIESHLGFLFYWVTIYVYRYFDIEN